MYNQRVRAQEPYVPIWYNPGCPSFRFDTPRAVGSRSRVDEVKKPSLTVADLVHSLQESEDSEKMFTLLGIQYLEESNPKRFIMLMMAGESIFARPFMTVELYCELSRYYNVNALVPKPKWTAIKEASHKSLIQFHFGEK